MTSYAIHAEVSADERRLIVMLTGVPPDLQAINDRWMTLTPVVQQVAADAVEMALSWPAVVQLAREFGPAWVPSPRLVAWIEREVRRRLAPLPDRLSFELPDELAEAGVAPKPHQVTGAHVIALTSGGRAVLWDEPRTGKTITCILGLREIAATWWPALGTRQAPVIVVCPGRAVTPWVRAFRAWWPSVTAVAWAGSPYTRKRRAGTAGVYVASWGVTASDAQDDTKSRSPLTHLGHAALVVDEGHRAKSPTADRTRAMQRLARRARVFVELTGTPIAHNFIDLQPRIQFLSPGWLSSKDRMRERWARTKSQDYGEPRVLGLDPRSADEFYECILGQWRWTHYADAVPDAPPKVHKVVEVRIPQPWRKVYDDVAEDMLARLPDGSELPSFGVLAQLQQLQQLANAAGDVEVTYTVDEETGEDVPHYHVRLKLPSWKVDEALNLIDERRGRQLILYAPSRQLILLAGREVSDRLGLRVGYIVGGMTRRASDRVVDEFQAGELDVICATTGAGGEAITLNRASTLIYLQRPWSGIESSQSEKRADGIEAVDRDETEIIDVVAVDSVEARIRKALKAKGGQLSELVRDPRVVAELLGGASVININRESA